MPTMFFGSCAFTISWPYWSIRSFRGMIMSLKLGQRSTKRSRRSFLDPSMRLRFSLPAAPGGATKPTALMPVCSIMCCCTASYLSGWLPSGRTGVIAGHIWTSGISADATSSPAGTAWPAGTQPASAEPATIKPVPLINSRRLRGHPRMTQRGAKERDAPDSRGITPHLGCTLQNRGHPKMGVSFWLPLGHYTGICHVGCGRDARGSSGPPSDEFPKSGTRPQNRGRSKIVARG